jgi:putative SOS response-associated peptidase YedK
MPTPNRARPGLICLDEDRPLAFFAGIWTTWRRRRGTKANPIGRHQLFGFPTTDANAEVGAIHPETMPVILTSTEASQQWLTLPEGACCRARHYISADLAQTTS